MKLHIFGSLSGMNPRPGRSHTAWALERNGGLHWFDAGENCSRTAFFMGLNSNDIRQIFISHFHSDHWFGLPGLIGTIRRPQGESFDLPVFTPEPELFQLAMILMERTGTLFPRTAVTEKPISPGVLSECDGVRVSAWGNTHLTPTAQGAPRSWSFLIEAEGRKIVYSGDVRSADELLPHIADCDVLLMESGHHSPVELCRRFKHAGHRIGKLIFLHHGFEIMNDYETAWSRVREIRPEEVWFAEDAQTFEL